MRFENSVQMSVDIPEALLDKQVPALSLQLLLENAIKHNAFDNASPLTIKVTGQAHQLQVSNNVKKRTQLNGSSGMGLELSLIHI